MAQRKPDLLSKLADRGEQMVGRITDLPGAKQLLDRTAALGKGLDDVQRRLRSLDPLERRVTRLEQRLEKLEGKGTASRTRTTGRARSTSAARSTAASGAKRSTARSKSAGTGSSSKRSRSTGSSTRRRSSSS